MRIIKELFGMWGLEAGAIYNIWARHRNYSSLAEISKDSLKWDFLNLENCFTFYELRPTNHKVDMIILIL